MTAVLTPPATIHSLQLGMTWFPEQAGNGLDRVFYALTRHLPEAGVETRGLVAGTDAVARQSGERVRAFAPEHASLWSRSQRMRRAVRAVRTEYEVDVVGSHFALYTFPALDLIDDVPLVVHFHGPWAEESRVEGAGRWAVRAKTQVERTVYGRGVRYIVLSQAFADELITRFGVVPEAIRIVPGGVDVDRFAIGGTRDDARTALGWPADRPIILSVRRLAHRMGLEGLITAFRDVHRRFPDALLYIVGKGPMASALQARIDAEGLDRHVRLLGFVDDERLPLCYRAADLTVVPTVALEGFGLITVESLAAGTPVLVTPRGGLPEVVGGLSEHLIFDAADADAMQARLIDVLRGTVSLPAPDECMAYARRHFDWRKVAEMTRDVYAEAIS